MKILKPGKVEQRKFTCPKCGCVFVASTADLEQDSFGTWAICPQEGCSYNFRVRPETGEPYEESNQETEYNIDRLAHILFAMPRFTDCAEAAGYLIANGVTFRED